MTFVKPENLPSTSAATKYHSLGTYHQVQIWKGRNDLVAQNWGWAVKGNRLLAVHTDRPPAPERLLKAFRCKCKTDCKTSRCTCRKHGLTCSHMCGECKGVSCLNFLQVDHIDIRKTCPCNVNHLKPHFYIEKLGYAGVYHFFLFLLQNIDCGYSLDSPRRGGSNVYPQSMF